MVKKTICPAMPAYNYVGVKIGVDNYLGSMDGDYYDNDAPYADIDLRNKYLVNKYTGEEDKIEMLKKYEKENLNEWENHFYSCLVNSLNIEVPRPVMVEGAPHFNGGLYMPNDEYDIDSDMDTVCDLKLTHFKVENYKIRNPTNEEYSKYFKKIYEDCEYRIKSFEPDRERSKKTLNGGDRVENHCMVVKNNIKVKRPY